MGANLDRLSFSDPMTKKLAEWRRQHCGQAIAPESAVVDGDLEWNDETQETELRQRLFLVVFKGGSAAAQVLLTAGTPIYRDDTGHLLASATEKAPFVAFGLDVEVPWDRLRISGSGLWLQSPDFPAQYTGPRLTVPTLFVNPALSISPAVRRAAGQRR